MLVPVLTYARAAINRLSLTISFFLSLAADERIIVSRGSMKSEKIPYFLNEFVISEASSVPVPVKTLT